MAHDRRRNKGATVIPVFDTQPTRLQLIEAFSKEHSRIYVLTELSTTIDTNYDIVRSNPEIRWLDYKLSRYTDIKFRPNFFIRIIKYYNFTKLGPSSISLFHFMSSAGLLYGKNHHYYKHVDWHSYISKEEIDLAHELL